jgi:hypothetical protein
MAAKELQVTPGSSPYNGASTAPAGWLISLALSPDDVIGNGDEIFLFSEPANFNVNPGGTLYRNDFGPGYFSLFYDNWANPVPDGVYYIALWLDPTNALAESNKGNNASLSWGVVGVYESFGLGANAPGQGGGAEAQNGMIAPGKMYNGKTLPGHQASVHKARISTTPQGDRQMQFIDEAPLLEGAPPHPLSKLVRAGQQVIFPVREMKLMRGGN